MAEHFDRIVIGGGAMGLATTWQLASRGVRVLMLERFGHSHSYGASHGATRNLNNAYAQSHYLDLYDEALHLWRQIEQTSGRSLLTLCGLVTHGNPLRVRGAYESLAARNAPVTLISAEEAATRWRGMHFDGEVLFNPEAGRISAAVTLETLAELSRQLGAELQYETRVTDIVTTDRRVVVSARNESGELVQYEAGGAVVTVGAWSSELLTDLIDLPPLRVTEEHPAHYKIRPEFEDSIWPSFNHFRTQGDQEGNRGNVYGMVTPGEGIKIGFHATGDEVHPDTRRFRASDAARLELREYVSNWFPGVDADSAVELSCTYTMTESERFVLDTRGLITVGAGFSGQGFKFVPAIGRVLADATLGERRPPKAFLLTSH